MGITDKIAEIEREIARTQKNKGKTTILSSLSTEAGENKGKVKGYLMSVMVMYSYGIPFGSVEGQVSEVQDAIIGAYG